MAGVDYRHPVSIFNQLAKKLISNSLSEEETHKPLMTLLTYHIITN